MSKYLKLFQGHNQYTEYMDGESGVVYMPNVSCCINNYHVHYTLFFSILEVTLEASPTQDVALGDDITYTATITNKGNVNVRDGHLYDDHVDLSVETFSLAPNESETFTYTYTVTQQDIDKGYVVNKLEVNAKSSIGHNPTNVIATTRVEAEEPQPVLSCSVVTTSEAPEEGYAWGDTIEYEITVENEGNVTIDNISLTAQVNGDESVDITSYLDKTRLSPGEQAMATFEHVVTEQDILAYSVICEVTADGDNPSDESTNLVIDTAEDPTVDPDGHLSVVLQTTSEAPEGGYALNDTVTYDLYVVNDGNLTITDIELDCERSEFSENIASLAPYTSSNVFQISTTVTEDDILSEHIINEATASGTSPDPDKPDVPVTQETTDDDPEVKNGHLTVDKVTTSTPANEHYYVLGERIQYLVTVTNSGNLTITDIIVTDEKTQNEWPINSLAPGESREFTPSYDVQTGDVADGEVFNVATAEGTSPDPDRPDVAVTPGEDPETCG